jgi:hypothetical protein
MQWIAPSLGVSVAFGTIVAAVVLMARLGVQRAAPEYAGRVTLGIAAVMAVTGGLAASGVLEAAPGVALVPFMAGCNGLALLLALSPVGRRLAMGLPLVALVGFQGFRLSLEIVLHRLYTEGVVPVAMTWEGRNIDVISGVLALLAVPVLRSARLARWHRPIAWLVGVVGFALLLNVAATAILSSPVPMRRSFEGPALQLAFHVPWVWIVPICVGGALAGHVVVFRSLLYPAPHEREVPDRGALAERRG